MLHKKVLLAAASLLICFGLISGMMPARAASSNEIRDQINQLEKEQEALRAELEALEKLLGENAVQLQQMVQQKQSLDQQITVLYAQISNTDQQIQAYGQLIADKQLELEKEQAHLAALKEAYKVRIRAIEEAGELTYWQILFEAKSMTDFLDRVNMVLEIAMADNRRMEEIREAAAKVADAQQLLQEEQGALEQVRGEMEDARQQLTEKSQKSNEMLQELLAKGAEFESLLDQAEQADEKLMEEIARLEDDFDDAVYQEWLATYVPPTTAPEAEYFPTVGDSGWLTPVSNYRLSSPFGMRLHPVLGYYRMHSGVDMACPEGTPIYASRGGKVTIARYSSSAGNYVQINHGDGYRSVYMHMTEYVVKAGQYVAQGQLIGYVGDTGISKGNHLHFGISYNGEYVNPMEFIG